MSAQPVLDVRNVSHGFNDQSGHRLSVLESLDLRINPGDSVAIIGPSGAGKSTLLSLLAGLDIPESGEILFQGEAFSGLSEDQREAGDLSGTFGSLIDIAASNKSKSTQARALAGLGIHTHVRTHA